MDTSVRNQLQSLLSKIFFLVTVVTVGITLSWWLVILIVPLWVALSVGLAFGLQPIILSKFGLNALTIFAWLSAPIKTALFIGLGNLLF